jgi:Predicted integral membrane protein (DUF2269)
VEELRILLLWLHIALAIVGLGPTFTFPVWTALARKAGPEHVPFALGTLRALITRMVAPLAILLLASGIALILVADWDLIANEWLWIALVLYTVNLALNLGVALPNLNAILGIVSSGEVPQRMAEIEARGRRQRLLGMTSGILVLVILGLMVWKPGA